MYGKVTINDKEVEFLANASTSFRFKNIFGIDLISLLAKGDEGSIDDYERLAFVMAAQAEKKDMSKLTEEDFYQWLESFEFNDLVEALPEIIGLYMQNKKTTSDPK